jgi:hypothetical protein
MPNSFNSVGELATTVEFWSATVGALVGGGLAAWASFRATKTAHRFAERKHEHDEKMRLKRILQALHDEAETVWGMYSQQMGPYLDGLEDGKPVTMLWRIEQDYFTVFHTNADNIGLIENEQLRKMIIQTYSKAKGTIDSFRMNNDLALDYKDRAIRSENTKLELDKKLLDGSLNSLVTYAALLKQNNTTLKKLFAELLPLLKGEVTRLTSETKPIAPPWWKKCYGCKSI